MSNALVIHQELNKAYQQLHLVTLEKARLEGKIEALSSLLPPYTSATEPQQENSETAPQADANNNLLRTKIISEPKQRPNEMESIRKLIERAGRPMHVSEIAETLGNSSGKKKGSIGTNLSKYAEKKKDFIKTAPNTFGLIGKNYDVNTNKMS